MQSPVPPPPLEPVAIGRRLLPAGRGAGAAGAMRLRAVMRSAVWWGRRVRRPALTGAALPAISS
ncbi:hypothetical protein ACIBQ1_38465 [Nonomuraea sp. NPDC050153]|uniref:hypothetical protein n=1 Tax=Nonomuraea sp. NPDC050153 TaxID=3364359 RepID=UPI0037A6668C